mgnify:CR=1 FL=1
MMGATVRRPLRILLGKIGLDGHTRGLQAVAGVLRDAGMEVIYAGMRRRPAEIAQIARDEDVDAIGLSFMSGSHIELMEDLLAVLAERGIDDIPVIAGGIIPRDDAATLRAMGVRAVLHTGASGEQILEAFRSIAASRTS